MFRFCLFPGGFVDLVYRTENDTSLPLAFLAQAYQQLRLVLRNGVYQQFTYVNHAPKASPVPSVALRYAVCLTAPACGYIVPRASDHFLVACLRSLRLKVQPVCLMTLFISNNLHCDFVSHISNAVSWTKNSKLTSSLGQLVLSKFVKPGLSTVSVDN